MQVFDVNFKMEIWCTLRTARPIPEEIIEKIKKEEISSNEIFTFLDEEGLDPRWVRDDNTEELISVEQNDGDSTVTIEDESGNIIWGNGVND